MKIILRLFLAFLIFTTYSGCSNKISAESEIFIRVNQLGFLPDDLKTAVILSNTNLSGKIFSVIDKKNNMKIFSGRIGNNEGKYGDFNYTYVIDFSKVRNAGIYFIEVENQKSYEFKIGSGVYNQLAEYLLEFFKVQRCGYTNPKLHGVCHIADATSLIIGKNVVNQSVDVTGGWHDAGDYIKFLNTTAYSTYMLLFSYEFDPSKFSFDNNKNNVADILEEAKIGLDWMLRCHFKKDKLITQVQDLRDHEVGWRLPEDDSLQYDRPAFVGIGKNLIGIYTATMSLAYRIWKDVLNYPEFANKCLSSAKELYSIRNNVPNIDSSGTGMYLDNNYYGKLALGAVELYLSTGNKNYLNDSEVYADSAGSDFWWSWGNINSIVHYRLASIESKFQKYIFNNLIEFNKNKSNNLFGEGAELTWGTNVTLLGIALQNILWRRLTSSNNFDSLEIFQRDFILGRNPWGVSFIYKIGTNYTKHFHHQIAYIKGELPGGLAAGPATKSFLLKYNMPVSQKDVYKKFQTDAAIYRDDRMDFITNEPTITGNATAIFVFGNLKN
ncbi:glycoside hydrolase family 9 protein [Melioribacteraceae bacterium 4301-Me]|uniref:glycoside hydrolase family 9 protein n=1 Tax=Pyranulibacter aquaticus TaxID=3163344 RepID=UPI003596A05D